MAVATYSVKLASFLTDNLLSGEFLEFARSEGTPITILINGQTGAAAVTDETFYAVPRGKILLIDYYIGSVETQFGYLSLYDTPTMVYDATKVKINATTGSWVVQPMPISLSSPACFKHAVHAYISNTIAATKYFAFTLTGLLVDVEHYEKWLAEKKGGR